MIDFKMIDEMFTKAIAETKENIAKVMKMEGMSEEDKEKLKKANETLNKSRQDLENYKQKLKNDFNI